MRKRTHVYYSGNVQGVGFRFTVAGVARAYVVEGFVRNLGDGRVEVVAEGEKAEIKAFLADVSEKMAGYIHCAEAAEEDCTGEYESFSVRY